MRFFGGTDQGLLRPTNQDAYYIDSQKGWAVVADGMGGHNGGETASGMAVEIIRKSMEDNLKAGSAIEEANKRIYEKSLESPSLSGMGTTVVLCTVSDDKNAVVSHVGDSRAYIFSNGELKQITTDHSIVQQLIESGTITKEQAKHHPQRNLITRAVGTERDVKIDFNEVELENGDVILICSDGLSSYVDEREIAGIINDGVNEKTVEKLIDAANNSGGKDNVTVVLIEA